MISIPAVAHTGGNSIPAVVHTGGISIPAVAHASGTVSLVWVTAGDCGLTKRES